MPRIKAVIAICSLIIIFSCEIIHAEEQKWKFVQSVGGISVGSPSITADGWSLPINADVSGLKKITVTPTALNSGMACDAVSAKVEGNNIYLSLITGIAGGKDSQCPEVFLGHMPTGEYTVYYRSKGEQPMRLSVISFKQ